uniref:Uncharacterized protein n=1 Tax=Rhizophora mucronata TaxID=61149 RepID=A0A2P2NW92_RHIMU
MIQRNLQASRMGEHGPLCQQDILIFEPLTITRRHILIKETSKDRRKIQM